VIKDDTSLIFVYHDNGEHKILTTSEFAKVFYVEVFTVSSSFELFTTVETQVIPANSLFHFVGVVSLWQKSQ
jgi:hypothetical protein